MAGRTRTTPDKRLRWLDWLSLLLLIVSGFGLTLPGAYLVTLGGSPYYALAGLGLLACAVLVWRGRSEAPWLILALLAVTLLWSLWEVGTDGWALMPRLVFFIVAALWLLFTARAAIRRPARLAGFGLLAIVAVTGVAAAIVGVERPATVAAEAGVSDAAASGEWDAYGSSVRGTRYSPLGEITPANVGNLELAWTYRTGPKGPDGKRNANLQLTPLMVDGTLYGCTAFAQVFALDPVTGKQRWRTAHDVGEVRGGHPTCRGVAFFRAPANTAECPTRILFGTVDSKLIALDARTGAYCRGFGTNGIVDLKEGIGDFPPGWSHPTSPPTIVNGVAVIGAYVVDNQSTNAPPGVIRGFDAVTGALKWAFDPGRPDDHAAPPPGQFYTPSTPNSWTIFSGDPALGLVYIPTGNGSPDFIGAGRSPETERFSSSLIALDAATGAVRWSFQAVHHDLWDYDLAGQAALVDLPAAGGSVPGLILPSKNGQVYLLDRRTGRPLSRIVERAVPKSVLATERASPTQPVSVDMPDFAGAMPTERDMWGISPFDQLYCRIKFRETVFEGQYTPLQLKPTLRFPGELGGIDWGSVSVDERRGLLIVNSNRMADRDQLITRAQADAEGLQPRRNKPGGHNVPGGAMEGTPYAVHWGPFLTGLDVPCQRPPYGLLSAVDLRTGKLAWQRTLGDARNSGPFGYPSGLPLKLGAPNIGGSVATASGLIFIAATQDEMFRAFDTRSGKLVWQVKLPAAGHATPMTYRGRDGRQYVVIAAGGQSLKDKPGDHLMAFRLPRG